MTYKEEGDARILMPAPEELIVHYEGAEIILPQDMRKEADAYFETLRQRGASVFRDVVYHVQDCVLSHGSLTCTVAQSDYSHYAWAKAHPDEAAEYGFWNVHAGTVVCTSDRYLILGEMASNTVRAGKIQPAGGGVDRADLLNGKRSVLQQCAGREGFEEFGLDFTDENTVTSFQPFLVCKDDFEQKIAVMFRADITFTAMQVEAVYERFARAIRRHGGEPEFARLHCVREDATAIDAFINTHRDRFSYYVEDLLRYCANMVS